MKTFLKSLPVLVSLIASTVLIQSCQKNPGGGNGNGTGTTNNCFLIREYVTGGSGYVGNYQYEYDASGILTKASTVAVNGLPAVQVLAVSGNQISFSTGPTYTSTFSYDGGLRKGTPTTGYQDIIVDGRATPHWRDFIFSYGDQQNVTHVAWLPGELNMNYDAKGNVVKMTFITNNGPRVPSTIVTVEGYDDKPTPFVAEGKFWKFIQHMFSWDYFPEYLMVAALSNNNPGKITIQDYIGNDKYETTIREMTYTYDDQGHITTAITTEIRPNRSPTQYQSARFEYDCK